MKKPSELSPFQINRALDELDKRSSANTRAFIEAGRGHERPSEYLQKTDPLAMEARAILAEYRPLMDEVEKYCGLNASRFPGGFRRPPAKRKFHF